MENNYTSPQITTLAPEWDTVTPLETNVGFETVALAYAYAVALVVLLRLM